MAEDAEGKGHLWNLCKPMCEGTLNPAAVSLLQKLAVTESSHNFRGYDGDTE